MAVRKYQCFNSMTHLTLQTTIRPYPPVQYLYVFPQSGHIRLEKWLIFPYYSKENLSHTSVQDIELKPMKCLLHAREFI